MIVHVASFLESIDGSIDKEHYLRPVPARLYDFIKHEISLARKQ